MACGIFVEKFDDASGQAEEMYRSAQKKLESVFDNVYSRMQAKFVLRYHRSLDITDVHTWNKGKEVLGENCIRLVKYECEISFFWKNMVIIQLLLREFYY